MQPCPPGAHYYSRRSGCVGLKPVQHVGGGRGHNLVLRVGYVEHLGDRGQVGLEAYLCPATAAAVARQCLEEHLAPG